MDEPTPLYMQVRVYGCIAICFVGFWLLMSKWQGPQFAESPRPFVQLDAGRD